MKILRFALSLLFFVASIVDAPAMFFASPPPFYRNVSAGAAITVTGYSTPSIDESGSSTTTVTYSLSGSAGFIAVSVDILYIDATQTCVTGITGITWNGVSLTQAVSIFQTYGTIFCQQSAVYYLESPATGSNNLVVTNAAASGPNYVSVQIIGMTNVATSSPVAATATANTAGSNTVALSTSASTMNSIRVGCRMVSDQSGTSQSFTAAGITITQNDQDSGEEASFFNGYLISTSSGSVNFSTTYSNGTSGTIDTMAVVAFKGTS